MLSKLKTKLQSLELSTKQIFGGLMIYFTIRIFSYFFSPGTPLYEASIINWIISGAILAAAVYFLIKKDMRGWIIIAAEMILGGAGNFLEIKNISLRTILLVFSIGIFVFHATYDKKWKLFIENKPILLMLAALYTTVAVSAVQGYLLGNNPKLILADCIPYLFFLYYFPLKQLLSSVTFRSIGFNMIFAAIIGNFIFTYVTLAGFSSGILILQDSYYHWFRDVAGGKITNFNTGFFRIVLNEQLLMIPIFLYLFSKQLFITTKKNISLGLSQISAGMLLAILTINLTRIYFMSLFAGILLLFSFKNWKKWLLYSGSAFVIFISIFIFTHVAATKGDSLGLEYLGIRLQSIAMPQTEDSSLSRMLLLPKIIKKIQDKPILGNGLGDTVTVYSPVFKQNITTPHFDWGYLEILAEMGIIGLLAWLTLIAYCLMVTYKNRGLLVTLIALLIINLTSPALFHVMGIILFTFLLTNTKPAIRTGKTPLLASR